MGVVKAICISERKGTAKQEVPEVYLAENWGIEGDAHAGNWHRQVSLLAFEEIEDFRARGANVDFGAFGENLIVEGIGTPLKVLPVGTHLQLGDISWKSPRSARSATITAPSTTRSETASCPEKESSPVCCAAGNSGREHPL